MSVLVSEKIERRIYSVNGHRIMFDSDLADLYQVTTYNLNKAVQRNAKRFPADFKFTVTAAEADAIQKKEPKGRGGRRKPVSVFTEQGVAMLSTVLQSQRAISVNIEIMRAFVRLRHLLATNGDLARRLDLLESKYDKQFRVVFEAIRQLMSEDEPRREQIGFKTT